MNIPQNFSDEIKNILDKRLTEKYWKTKRRLKIYKILQKITRQSKSVPEISKEIQIEAE